MTIYTLLLLLSMYGSPVPDIEPASDNWKQPHGEFTNFTFDNLSHPDTTGFDFFWTIQGNTYQSDALPLDWLHPMECEGVMPLTITARQRITQTVYERTICVYVVWSWYDYPTCEEVPCTFVDVLNQPLLTDFEPHQYRVDCGLDADCDGLIGAVDLLNILTQIENE